MLVYRKAFKKALCTIALKSRYNIRVKGGRNMDVSSIMSMQLMELQQTVQMSVMQKAMNMETSAVAQMVEQMPQIVTPSLDPNVGQNFDVSI